MREYKKVTSTPGGSAGHYVPKWPLFDLLSFLKDTINNYTTKSSDTFTAEANVSLSTCSIVIHEDGTTQPYNVSPASSSSSYSPLYSSTPSPSCNVTVPSPPEATSSQAQPPSVVLLSTAMPPKSSPGNKGKRKRSDTSDLEEDCREALQKLQVKEKEDFSSCFGKAVTHWLRERPDAERMSAASKIMDVMKSFE